MAASAIEFDKLEKTYRQGLRGKPVAAVKDLSFRVPTGVVFGFLGANGAGKTTSIKILLGMQAASSGRALLLGKPCTDKSARENVGYLPERPYFHDNLTAEEFLDFHRRLFPDFPSGRVTRENKALLDLVGIPGTEKKILRSFSKGMLQRIGIAQAIVHDPDLVILDEPMSGLDPVGRKEVRKLILDLAAQGKTIFFSTHILADVESICDRIAFLEKGALQYEGSLENILCVRSAKFEILFSGPSAETLKDQPLLRSATPHGNAWRIIAKGEENQAILEQIWLARGRLVSVNLQQKTLEEALFGAEKAVP